MPFQCLNSMKLLATTTHHTCIKNLHAEVLRKRREQEAKDMLFKTWGRGKRKTVGRSHASDPSVEENLGSSATPLPENCLRLKMQPTVHMREEKNTSRQYKKTRPREGKKVKYRYLLLCGRLQMHQSLSGSSSEAQLSPLSSSSSSSYV